MSRRRQELIQDFSVQIWKWLKGRMQVVAQDSTIGQTTKYFAKRGDIWLGKMFFRCLLRLCLLRAQAVHVSMGFTGQDRVFCFHWLRAEQKKMGREPELTVSTRRAWSAALVQEDGPGINPGFNLPSPTASPHPRDAYHCREWHCCDGEHVCKEEDGNEIG